METLFGVLNEILIWSQTRPEWQRDALRRLVTGKDSANIYEELTALCRREAGLGVRDTLVAQPLSEKHVPAGGEQGGNVRLLSIDGVEGVNALAKNQAVSFAKDGLTIIYGDNGSGKSGYVRILKKLCRARKTGDLLPNAFSDEPAQPARATVTYSLSGQDQHIEYRWTDGQPGPSALSNISVFDSDCASIHVEEANNLAFTPFGLDLLSKLAGICQKVRTRLNHEKEELTHQSSNILSSIPEKFVSTEVGKLLEKLGPDSDVSDYEKFAGMTEEDIQELGRIREQLKQDPAVQKTAVLRLRKRLERLSRHLQDWENVCSREAVEQIRGQVRTVQNTRHAAAAAAKNLFSAQPIEGLGDDVWKELWEAARKFSSRLAYPASGFPHVDTGSRCVLCLQPLGDAAKQRLQDFESFVRQETQENLTRQLGNLSELFNNVYNLFPWPEEELLSEISAKDAACGEVIRDVTSRQALLKMDLMKCIEGELIEYDDWPKDVLDTSGSVAIENLIVRLKAEAVELENLEDNERLAALTKRRLELEAREWLGRVLEDVNQEILRHRTMRFLEAAVKSTDTGPITRKSTELSNTAVTEPLRQAFAEELRRLGFRQRNVTLEAKGGQYGEQRFQVMISGAAYPVGKIVSEGEHRCIALAAFLSEHATAQDSSAMVFDDPVSSLDHQYRRYVAERLVREAQARQVIVFTHDLVFLVALSQGAKAKGVPECCIQLWREGDVAGVQHDGRNWAAMTVKQRIGFLNNKTQEADAVYRRELPAYRPLAEFLYGRLRETWERAVEEVLFDGTIYRYGFEVQTRKLRHLHDINKEDIRAVEEGMSKCSQFMPGHDSAPPENNPIPPPDEVREDIKSLEVFVDAIRNRRK